MNISKTHRWLHFLPPTLCLTLSYIYYLQTIFQKPVETLETGSHYHWRHRYPDIEFAHSYTLTNYNHAAYIDGWVMVYPKKNISSLYKFIHSNCHIVSMYPKTGRESKNHEVDSFSNKYAATIFMTWNIKIKPHQFNQITHWSYTLS